MAEQEELFKREYYVRKAGENYEVAKFEGGDAPESVYVVRKMSKPFGKLKCDCPAGVFRGSCKHVPMVAQFINKGEKMPFVIKE